MVFIAIPGDIVGLRPRVPDLVSRTAATTPIG
jgi:hypothetical protein